MHKRLLFLAASAFFSYMERNLEKMLQILHIKTVVWWFQLVGWFLIQHLVLRIDLLVCLNYLPIFSSPHATHQAHKSQCETKLCINAHVKIWWLQAIVREVENFSY